MFELGESSLHASDQLCSNALTESRIGRILSFVLPASAPDATEEQLRNGGNIGLVLQHVPGHTGKLGLVEDKDGSLIGSLTTLHDMKPPVFSSVVIQKSPVSSASGTFGEEHSGWNLETQGSEHNCDCCSTSGFC